MTIRIKTWPKLALLSFLAFIAARSCAQDSPEQAKSIYSMPLLDRLKFKSNNRPFDLTLSFTPLVLRFTKPSFQSAGSVVALEDTNQSMIHKKWNKNTVQVYQPSWLSYHSIHIPKQDVDYTYRYFYQNSPTDITLRPRLPEHFKVRTVEDKLNLGLYFTGLALQIFTQGRQQ